MSFLFLSYTRLILAFSFQSVPACPLTCTGYSVCFLDCSKEDEGVEPEAMCTDITTTQYSMYTQSVPLI